MRKKSQDSYQVIALAMTQSVFSQLPLQGLASKLGVFQQAVQPCR
jgi:hypothetical protein